eukprot:3801444-Rhodomonas_salina.1
MLAIGVSLAVTAQLTWVVEFCITAAELRPEHPSQQNQQQIIANLIGYCMAWCTIAHLGGKLAIGLLITERIAQVHEICIQTVIPKSVHNSSQHPSEPGTNSNFTEWYGAGLLTCIDSLLLERQSPCGSPGLSKSASTHQRQCQLGSFAMTNPGIRDMACLSTDNVLGQN